MAIRAGEIASSGPGGTAEVKERHSCLYRGDREKRS